jgi:predicted metalloprotease with PDZ domain
VVASSENTFRAANYDILYDSPFEVSNFQDISFNVQGKPHRIVMSGDGNYDLKKLSTDITKIVEKLIRSSVSCRTKTTPSSPIFAAAAASNI